MALRRFETHTQQWVTPLTQWRFVAVSKIVHDPGADRLEVDCIPLVVGGKKDLVRATFENTAYYRAGHRGLLYSEYVHANFEFGPTLRALKPQWAEDLLKQNLLLERAYIDRSVYVIAGSNQIIEVMTIEEVKWSIVS